MAMLNLNKALAGYGESQAKVLRVAVVCLVFAGLFATALLVDSALRPVPAANKQNALNRPDDTITRSRYPLAGGKNCRETVFDRSSGDIIKSATAPCDSEVPSIRRQHDFTWRGK
ncbi:MAG TPA: hypothetical protein VFB45_11425 [Pseudolabrys sp.]|nr:hypothetical protein [Pseudolabrys sp.]